MLNSNFPWVKHIVKNESHLASKLEIPPPPLPPPSARGAINAAVEKGGGRGVGRVKAGVCGGGYLTNWAPPLKLSILSSTPFKRWVTHMCEPLRDIDTYSYSLHR